MQVLWKSGKKKVLTNLINFILLKSIDKNLKKSNEYSLSD